MNAHSSTTRDVGKTEQDARKLALIAGLLGVAGGVALGSLRFINDKPTLRDEVLGNVVFGLVYLSPYLLALALSRRRDPVARGGLLLALTGVSFLASFSAFSLVTVVLLPGTVGLFLASAWSLRAASHMLPRASLFLLAGLLGVAGIAFSFYALFGLQADEARCWALVQVSEGQREWQARPNTGGNPNRLSIGPTGPSVAQSSCVSDIITESEALVGLGILAGASAFLIGISGLPAQLVGGMKARAYSQLD